MEKIKILVADDVEIQREVLKNIIEKIEYVELVGIAEDGQAEYNLIKELNPQLVLTDNQMPILNGVDVIKKIREENDRRTDFIIITGDRGLFAEVRDSKVFDILNKPYDERDLIELLDTYRDCMDSKVEEKENQTESTVIEKKKSFLSKLFGK